MTPMPSDVWDIADNVAQKIADAMWEHEDGTQMDWGAARKTIANAILAERERCAKIARTLGVYPELNIFAGGPEWYRHGKDISKAILNSSTTPQVPLSVDEKSRDAELPSVSAPSSGQE